MKKKVVTVVVILAVVCVGVLIGVWIAGRKGCIKHGISTVEELYAMESDKSYQLECDLDLGEREWYPLTVKSFDGQGYTISNCYISDTDASEEDSGFFRSADTVKNVTFDNVQMQVSKPNRMFVGIVVGDGGEVQNIALKNSMLTVSHAYKTSDLSEEIYVGLIAGIQDGSVSGLTVDNCKLKLTSNDCDVRIGGVFGSHGGDIDSCSISNTEVTVTNKEKYSDINFGGIAGKNEGSITNCSVKNLDYSLSSVSENLTRCGGIVGVGNETINTISDSEKEISSNFVSDSTFTVSTAGNYNVGGVVGKAYCKISDCLSDSNVLTASTTATSSSTNAYVAGVVGTAGAALKNCVAQGCTISGTTSTKSENMIAVGLVANPEGTVINCAVYDNVVSGGKTDIFGQKASTLQNCYAYVLDEKKSFNNANDVEVLAASEWTDVITKLSLDGSLWSMASGKLVLNI